MLGATASQIHGAKKSGQDQSRKQSRHAWICVGRSWHAKARLCKLPCPLVSTKMSPSWTGGMSSGCCVLDESIIRWPVHRWGHATAHWCCKLKGSGWFKTQDPCGSLEGSSPLRLCPSLLSGSGSESYWTNLTMPCAVSFRCRIAQTPDHIHMPSTPNRLKPNVGYVN